MAEIIQGRRAEMIDLGSLQLSGFSPEHLDELVRMWRESFEDGVGIQDFHPIEDQKQYFLTQVLRCHDVRLALSEGLIVGFIAASHESVSQLYVRCGFQRAGLGTRSEHNAGTTSRAPPVVRSSSRRALLRSRRPGSPPPRAPPDTSRREARSRR